MGRTVVISSRTRSRSLFEIKLSSFYITLTFKCTLPKYYHKSHNFLPISCICSYSGPKAAVAARAVLFPKEVHCVLIETSMQRDPQTEKAAACPQKAPKQPRFFCPQTIFIDKKYTSKIHYSFCVSPPVWLPFCYPPLCLFILGCLNARCELQ